ncbi:SbcC/MukB-like Walker B domain-containing protein, partial [Paenibacillus macerans]|uniref:SbcC/MukB-like Walker B domain-containing protein n=1 Tax=Paenibacillus macerans TaxID=44252 RepID=UPI003D324340
ATCELSTKSNATKTTRHKHKWSFHFRSAVQFGQQLAALGEQLAKAEAEEAGGRASMQQAADTLQRAVGEEQAAVAAVRGMAQPVRETARQLSGLEDALQAYAGELAGREAALRQGLKDRERHRWSARLAEELAGGEPCPVCGSVHHPALAQADEGESAGSEAELEAIIGLIAASRELLFDVSRDRDVCLSLLDTLNAPDEDEGAASDSGKQAAMPLGAREVAATLTAAAGDASEPVALAAAERHGAALREQHADCRRRLEALQKDYRAAQSGLAAVQPQRAAAEAAVAAASGLLEQAVRRCAEGREALGAKRRDWDGLYPGLTPEDAARRLDDFAAKDRMAEDLRQRLAASIPFIEEKTAKLQALASETVELDKMLLQWEVQEQGKRELLGEKQERLFAVAGDRPADELLGEARERLAALRNQAETARVRQAETAAQSNELSKAEALARQAAASAGEQETQLQERWRKELEASPFDGESAVTESLLAPGEADTIAGTVQSHRTRERELEIGLGELDAKLNGQTVSGEEWQAGGTALAAAKEQDEAALQAKARAERDWEDLQIRHVRWKELESSRAKLEHEAGMLAKLQSALRGNAFVEYVAEEQLMNVSHAASQRLRFLTKQRYALETDSGGGFVICDDANGGVKRPVATLSGGETFLTSLALALALSAQIQLRGQYPLQFFFLDEGFGTLDPELLDTVITSLEHLHHDHLAVGIISHVAELRSRLARKLVVIPAESGGAGSRVEMERL